MLLAQPHEGAAERIVGDNVGKVAADALRQDDVVDAELLAPQHVRRRDRVERLVGEHGEVGRHIEEFAGIGVDPDAEHALLAPRHHGGARDRRS